MLEFKVHFLHDGKLYEKSFWKLLPSDTQMWSWASDNATQNYDRIDFAGHKGTIRVQQRLHLPFHICDQVKHPTTL